MSDFEVLAKKVKDTYNGKNLQHIVRNFHISIYLAYVLCEPEKYKNKKDGHVSEEIFNLGVPAYVKKIVMFHRVWEDVQNSYDRIKHRYNSFPVFYQGSKLLGTGKNLAISIVQVAFAFVSMINEDKSINSVNNALDFIMINRKLIYGRAAELLYDMIGNKKMNEEF